jgi:hypothetical protein
MANEADILVRFGADVGPLKKGAKDASTSLDKVGTAAKAGGVGLAKLGTAAAAAGVAFLAFSKLVADNVTELKNQATVANTSITNFKNMAFAAKSVGVEQDTLADILKDVNDKIGDFVQTGAGPMVDFFEKIGPMVGVTADNFKDLSGDQALKLYVDSLNSANLSQSDMVFYMEAIASDATKLLPLYADQSAELERLSQKYSDVNDELALTANQADALGDLKESFDLLGVTAGNAGTQVISTFAKPLTEFLEATTEMVPVLTNKFVDFFNTFLDAENISSVEDINTQLENTNERMIALLAYKEQMAAGGGLLDGSYLVTYNEEVERLEQRLMDLNIQKEKLETKPRLEQVGTGAGGPTGQSDADYLAKRRDEEKQKLLDNQIEIVDIVDIQIKTLEDKEKEHLAEMARLNKEYVDGRLTSGEDFSKTDLERQEDWAKASKAIESTKHKEARDAASQFFGGMAVLMSSSVEEEFKIGKAAAIAQASIDGVSAAISSFKYGADIGGPVVGALMAASSAVSTGMMLNKLYSASSSGSSSGSPAAGVSSAAAVSSATADAALAGNAPQSNSQSRNLHISGIDPGSMFSGDQVRSLIDKINEAGSDGKQVMLR